MTWPAGPQRAGEDVLAEQLAHARAVVGQAEDRATRDGPALHPEVVLTDAQERLRWSELPADARHEA